MLDVSSEYPSNDIEYTPRITIETKWTDALRSRYYNFISLSLILLFLSLSGFTLPPNYQCLESALRALYFP